MKRLFFCICVVSLASGLTFFFTREFYKDARPKRRHYQKHNNTEKILSICKVFKKKKKSACEVDEFFCDLNVAFEGVNRRYKALCESTRLVSDLQQQILQSIPTISDKNRCQIEEILLQIDRLQIKRLELYQLTKQQKQCYQELLKKNLDTTRAINLK